MSNNNKFLSLQTGKVSTRNEPPRRQNSRQQAQNARPSARTLRNRRRRARQRARNASIQASRSTVVNMQMEAYKLHENLKDETLCYAESVVSPFNARGIGAKKPDGAIGTRGATDRLDSLLPIKSLIESAPSSAGVNGVLIALLPRSLAVGWADGQIDPGVSTANHIVPNLNRFELAPNLANAALPQPVVSDPYCILITFLGTSNFYGIDTTTTTSLATQTINFIRTSRQQSMYANFDTMRILGAGLKLWSNAAPVQTGGRVLSGGMRNQDLYQVLSGQNNNVTAATVESILKDGYQTFSALDGTTLRYNPTVDRKQKEFQRLDLEDYMQIVINSSGPNLYNVGEQTQAPKIYDLADANSMIPVAIWRFGNEQPYDLTIRTIFHVEGATDGVCPFESEAPISEPALHYIEKILNSSKFPKYVKGHSFKSFMDTVKNVVGHITKGAGTIAKIMKMVEQFGDLM